MKKPGGTTEWREVTLGAFNGKCFEIKAGLEAGEMVAIDPVSLMSDDEKRQKLAPPRRPTTRKNSER